MKKFLCMTMLMLAALTVSAMAQTKAASPPEQDIGYQQAATLSLDGMTVYALDFIRPFLAKAQLMQASFCASGLTKRFHSQLNIVDWQTPVMVAQEASTAAAQVVGAVTIATTNGEVSMTLVSYRWPNSKTEMMNLRNDYTGNYAPDGDAYSFTSSRADFS